MGTTVCLSPPNTLYYPEGGGHLWVFLNWALGLRELGCEVIWLEGVNPDTSENQLQECVTALRNRLAPYGLAECVALYSRSGEALPRKAAEGCLDLDAAVEADLLLNLQYKLSPEVVQRFRRSVLLDIDPGLLQMWTSNGKIKIARHDVYFTIGETVGQQGARFPDLGLKWNYTPPCVALPWWPPHPAAADAPFTTVAHWYASAWLKNQVPETKRCGFLPFLDLPRYIPQPFELALDLVDDDQDRVMLQERGWRVSNSHAVASTPWDYQRYIQDSRGEFSCVKPACIRLQNAWVSDRTLCYLASGKPAVVQHTGVSRFLPDRAGLFRFRDMKEAVRCVQTVTNDYERQCCLARALASEYFDARKVVGHLLDQALN